MKIPESFWTAIGKITALASLLGAVAGLWAYFSAPQGDLVAELHYGPQYWPPSASDVRGRVAALLDTERASKIVRDNSTELEPKSAERLASGILLQLKREMLESDLGEYAELGGFWHANVRNEGDLPVSDVALILPDARVAEVTSGNQSKLATIESGIISLGTLRPSAKVQVIAWTNREPGYYDLDEVVLSHAKGMGDLEVYEVSAPLVVFLRKNWFPIAAFLLGIGLMVLMVLQGIAAAKTSPKKYEK